ncbi:MAG: PfkB family carbohydrate kinase, partial [bacterium]|nr:PfkB family carbohydrate kinase [bacterium]
MILASGSLAYDRIMNYDGFFRDHINLDKLHSLSVSFMAKKFSENFGGTAGNIAYNLALLGEKSCLISSVGKDFLPYQKWLLKNKIDLSLVQKIKNENTAGAYIMTDKADCQITAFYPGAMQHHVTRNTKHV